MSYTPTTWTTGDTITASALNKIEQGIAGAGNAMIVTIDADNQLDKTYKEIWDALNSHIPVYVSFTYGDCTTYYECITWNCPVVIAYKYNQAYSVIAMKPRSSTNWNFASLVFTTGTVNGYPAYSSTRYISASTASDSQLIW